MISSKTMLNALQQKLIFYPLNATKSERIGKDIQRLRAKYLDFGHLPKSALRSYVRLVITLDIGVYLKDNHLQNMVFHVSEYPELHSAWYNPHDYFQ
tara:strand:+ start:173 stop:463 length:291 start_codon:yes stop_codon:yes gene_type:complete